MITQEMIDRVYLAAYPLPDLLEGEAQAREHVSETLNMLLRFRDDGCDRAEAERHMLDALNDLDLESLGETYAAAKRRLISASLDEIFPVLSTPTLRSNMIPDDFVDIVRKEAYPIDAPEGVEYERARVRECLEAAAGFKNGKDNSPLGVRAAREEAARIFAIALKAVY